MKSSATSVMRHRLSIALLAVAPMLAATPARVAAGFQLSYQYNLATLTGDIRLGGLGLSFDSTGNELYAIGYGSVRVFNASGMEVYTFGDDVEFGSILGLVALDDGDLLVLSYREGAPSLIRCNFRGEPQGKVELSGVPGPFAQGFRPNAIAYAKGKVYLADLTSMRILLTDAHGAYAASYDIAEMLDLAAKRADTGLSGFGVDRDGNLLFTIAPLFKAYVVSLDGQVRFFGKPGSAPGMFNIVSGIAADANGHIYVLDALKCAVIAFDNQFNFLGEFGYRGYGPGNLIAPRGVAVGKDKVYVAQGGRRGVAVYAVVAQ